MQRLKVLVLALFALFALGVVMAGAASAELPQLLTAGGVKVTSEKYTGTSGETKLTDGTETVSCKTSTSEGELKNETTAKGYLGPVHVNFKECTSKTFIGNATCTGEGDTSGNILFLGETHLVYDSLTTLGVAVLFLIPRFHFTCSLFGVNELLLVEGSLVCLIKPPGTLAKHFEVVCEATGGTQKETKYWNGAGVEQTASLKTSKGEGEFTESSQAGTGLILFTNEVKIDD
jgi:hypothetical protein